MLYICRCVQRLHAQCKRIKQKPSRCVHSIKAAGTAACSLHRHRVFNS